MMSRTTSLGDAMGMDLAGLKPTNSVGKYFYNTLWYWIPLWEYIASECTDIVTERDITLGGSTLGIGSAERRQPPSANSGHPASHRKDSGLRQASASLKFISIKSACSR